MDRVRNSEIFIGLVAPVGINLDLVTQTITGELADLGYASKEIRLSQLLKELPANKGNLDRNDLPEDERIDKYMDAGDALRYSTKRGDALVHLAVQAIRQVREETSGNADEPAPRQAYIFNSLKHPEEIRTLGTIYDDHFLCFSIFSPRADRVDLLASKISKSRFELEDKHQCRSYAERLVERDTNSGRDNLGQNVRDAFALSDVFINYTDKANVKRDLCRALELWFGHPFHTPKMDEHGMYHANAAALRSADLSRQVGAVIANSDGDILALGCNEVPKFKGGSVWEDDQNDFRDFRTGDDASAKMKFDLVAEIVKRFKESGLLSESVGSKDTRHITESLLFGDQKSVLKDAKVTSIIEYGRIVHAEMMAITDAAKRGVALKGTTLYCTTFPCHMCARHIIASGIERVVYIEPYPKSMAKDLYKKTIFVDEASKDGVSFESFSGIGPNKYSLLFQYKKRKTARGDAIEWDKTTSNPNIDAFHARYLESEQVSGTLVAKNSVKFGLTTTVTDGCGEEI